MSGLMITSWIQAASHLIVLFFIYWQLRQVRDQMSQNEEHSKFQRSWEFIRFYSEELREENRCLTDLTESFPEVMQVEVGTDLFQSYMRHFYLPRISLFKLLDQLVSLQQLDERVLFEYMEGDFNHFVQLGVRSKGAEGFKKSAGMKLLLSSWGSQIDARELLYG